MCARKLFLITTVASATLAGATTIALTQEDRISPIRQAAIEKLQEKLGEIRGSIKPKERRVFLTDTIIARLKPIQPDEIVAASQPAGVPGPNGAQVVFDQPNPIMDDQNTETYVSFDEAPATNVTPNEKLERKISAIAASNAARSERLHREIFRAVRMQMDSSNTRDNTITNSIGGGTLPNTSDMNSILAAVEQMVGETQ